MMKEEETCRVMSCHWVDFKFHGLCGDGSDRIIVPYFREDPMTHGNPSYFGAKRTGPDQVLTHSHVMQLPWSAPFFAIVGCAIHGSSGSIAEQQKQPPHPFSEIGLR